MRRGSRLLAVVGPCVVLALSLVACGPAGPDELRRSDIWGTWVNTGPAGEVASLEINRDGTFIFEDVPSGVFSSTSSDTPVGWGDLISARGTWSITRSGSDPYPMVLLVFDEKLTNGVKAMTLRCGGSGDNLRLYVLLDVDPDEVFYFDRPLGAVGVGEEWVPSSRMMPRGFPARPNDAAIASGYRIRVVAA
ncbi:MAG TPA: hypothetical protein VFT74_14625 [Isosphaeraceae bacterium]|nr:hypothetical protein [Isosphaeraceae bacterium]